MIYDITIQRYIYLQLFSIIFFKNQINFFVKRIYYINCLKYIKRVKIDHKKKKSVK